MVLSKATTVLSISELPRGISPPTVVAQHTFIAVIVFVIAKLSAPSISYLMLSLPNQQMNVSFEENFS